MYFWNMYKLRDELVANPLPVRDMLQYLIGFTWFYWGIITLHVALMPRRHIHFEYICGLTIFFALKCTGIYYTYRKNGGAQGQEFLTRYFSMAWVEFTRFGVTAALILILVVVPLNFILGSSGLPAINEWWAGGFILSSIVLYYWRLGIHFDYVVAKRSPESSRQLEPLTSF